MIHLDQLADDPADADLFLRVGSGLLATFNRMSDPGPAPPPGVKPPSKIDAHYDWHRTFLPDHALYAPSDLHRWLCDQCDTGRRSRGLKVNLLGPRSSAKTTIAGFSFPLRCALEGWEPLIWILGETHSQSCGHLENLKLELETNELLAYAYPHATGRGPLWRVDRIRLRNGVGIEAYGVGQKLRGRKKGAARPTLIIADDLQSDDAMTSPRLRERSRNWFHGTVLKAGTPRTNVIHLATALHRDALGSELLRTPGWNSKTFQSIPTWPTRADLWEEWAAVYHHVEDPDHKAKARAFFDQRAADMTAGAVVLWPEMEDLYTLMTMREESGRTTFEREKQCRPVNPDECEWPEEYFSHERLWFERWPDQPVITTLALDPSKGKSDKRGDYSAFVFLSIGRDDCLYVQASMARRPVQQMVADGVDMWRRHQPMIFGVEGNAWQDLLMPDFVEEFRRQKLLVPDVYAISNTVNKQVRIRRIGGYLSSHRLRFKQGCPSTRLLVEQLRDFPLGEHDDGPDALEMAVRLAEQMVNGRVS